MLAILRTATAAGPAGAGPEISLELLDDGAIEIDFSYDNGDEAILKAKRETSSTPY